MIPYFDSGIKLRPENVGWLKKDMASSTWRLTVTLDNRLRVPYKYEITVTKAGRDSTYEALDPSNANTYAAENPRIKQSVLLLRNAFSFVWENEKVSPWQKLELKSTVQGRSVDVYVLAPAENAPPSQSGYPALIALGSFTFGLEMPTSRIYQSLRNQGKAKPAVIALVDYKRYNTLDDFDSTGQFIVRDVLPFLRSKFRVSNEPGDIILTGTSRRGVVASYIAFRHDNVIGNVLNLSGGFSWKPAASNEFEWFTNLVASTERRKVKFYLSAGSLESVVTPNNRGHYVLAVNRHLRNVLLSKNYTFLYQEMPGGHNALTWCHGLYEGLAYLLKM